MQTEEFAGTTRRELYQTGKFPDFDNISKVSVTGGHNIAKLLKKKGELRDILEDCIPLPFYEATEKISLRLRSNRN